MRGLTKNIGDSTIMPCVAPGQEINIKRVLISRPNNRLGNLVLMTPLVQELNETFPDAKVDLFVRGGLGPIIFKNFKNVDRIIQLPKKPWSHLIDYTGSWFRLRNRRYDLVINVVKNSSSGRLSTKFAAAPYKIFGDLHAETEAQYHDHTFVAKYPVYNLRRYLSFMGIDRVAFPVPPLDIKLDAAERASGKALMQQLNGNTNPTIALFTFATGWKCYPPEWWEPVYARLQSEFTDYNIVEVLPMENVSQINFKAPSFYSRDIRELGSFIAAADVFIGADSGIMHLSSAVKTPTVGLFHVTDPHTFGPYDNHSLPFNTNECTTNDLIQTVKAILEYKVKI